MTQPFELVSSPVDSLEYDGGDVAPPGKAHCPDCGKLLTITAKGDLRAHKCVNEVDAQRAASGSKAKAKKAPDGVLKLFIPLTAGAIEWSAAHTLARTIPTSYTRARRAADMGDNDIDLFAPIFHVIWPELPKGAQQLLIRLADHSDLIACAFAWSDYIAGLRRWADDERARVVNEYESGVNGNEQTTGTPLAGVQPFRPVPNG